MLSDRKISKLEKSTKKEEKKENSDTTKEKKHKKKKINPKKMEKIFPYYSVFGRAYFDLVKYLRFGIPLIYFCLILTRIF